MYQDEGEVGSFCWIGEFEEVDVVVLGSDLGVSVPVGVDVDDRFLGFDFPDDDAGLLASFRGCMKIDQGDLKSRTS